MGEKDLSRGRWVDRHRRGRDRPDMYKGISGAAACGARRKGRGYGSDCGDNGAGGETEVSRNMHIKGSEIMLLRIH